MAKSINKATKETSHKTIEQYEHKDKQRVNNPPVGLVDAHTDNGGYKRKLTNMTHTLTHNCNGQVKPNTRVLMCPL